MRRRRSSLLFTLSCIIGGLLFGTAADALTLTRLSTATKWRLVEFRVDGVPPSTTPFDPDMIALDATLRLPDGTTKTIPGFFYRAYTRALNNGKETLTPKGNGEWRVRFCPPAEGNYTVIATVTQNGTQKTMSPALGFMVAESTLALSGYVTIAANKRYFATSTGTSLPLRGHDVCWYHDGGTYDYDTWLEHMRQGGENFTRIWMWPNAFGLEADAKTRLNYRQDTAWQLDYTLELAAQKGIYVQLCLDFHGMFAVQPDSWGGNNYWPKNPYNVVNGGPCVKPADFFTNAQARATYKKRLHYLIARYGYAPNLLGWEFFNEIDNVYSLLNATDVANWHSEMGTWLKANDPYHHLITTSFTSDHPEIWSLATMDYTATHPYGVAQPVVNFSKTAQSYLSRYGKPTMMGEFGTDWRGWNQTQNDPYLRGWRQGIWSGVLSGSVGTAMSWWWENIESEHLYPTYKALATFLNGKTLGTGDWQPVTFAFSDGTSDSLGDLIPGGQPFTATLTPNSAWGVTSTGMLALANLAAAAYAPARLNSFVHGSGHPELDHPYRIPVWIGDNGRLVLHLNSVSDGAIMQIVVDGKEVFRWAIPNKDGKWEVNEEYNQDVPVALPKGKHVVEVNNPGGDWYYLDWLRIENALPAAYAGATPATPLAIGLQGSAQTLVYLINPAINWPANAALATVTPMSNAKLTLKNWPAGTYKALWFNIVTGLNGGTARATVANGNLVFTVPSFTEDLAVSITKQ